MSQIAFSHKFAHRWSAAPKSVKGALVQELDDIVRLLDNDTPLEGFEFSIEDLNAHIDAIYEEFRAQTQTTEPQDTADENSLVDTDEQIKATDELAHSIQDTVDINDEVNDDHTDASNIETAEQNTDALIRTDNSDSHDNDNTSVVAPSEEADQTPNHLSKDQPSVSTESKASSPEPQQLSGSSGIFQNTDTTGEIDEEFIRELESKIDDYLSEQMMQMSEDLKLWLRDQIKARMEK